MKYEAGWGKNDILPEMWYWCIQHGETATYGPNPGDSYCWRCLSDCEVVNGENIIKCRVVDLGEALRRGRP